MTDDKQNFTLLAIVAVVAVVGLIILAMGGVNTKFTKSSFEGKNVAGMVSAQNCYENCHRTAWDYCFNQNNFEKTMDEVNCIDNWGNRCNSACGTDNPTIKDYMEN